MIAINTGLPGNLFPAARSPETKGVFVELTLRFTKLACGEDYVTLGNFMWHILWARPFEPGRHWLACV